MTPLYIHVKKGTDYKPGERLSELKAFKADYVLLHNGDAVGVIMSTSRDTRKILESIPGITVLPPMHRPLKPHHHEAFGHAKTEAGDTTYDVAEKLYEYHKMPWFHPEEHEHFF